MACIAAITTSPMTSLSSTQDLASFIKWVGSMPAAYDNQNYVALAITIEQTIEPIIRKCETRVEMQGDILPHEITHSKGFINLRDKFSPEFIDEDFIPVLNSSETPLTKSVVVSHLVEKINKISRIIFLTCRVDKDKSTLEFFCKGALIEFMSSTESLEGDCHVSAEASMSDSPILPHHLSLKMSKPSTEELASKDVLVMKKYYEHGICDKTTKHLSFEEDDKIIIMKQKRAVEKSSFSDLRYELERLI